MLKIIPAILVGIFLYVPAFAQDGGSWETDTEEATSSPAGDVQEQTLAPAPVVDNDPWAVPETRDFWPHQGIQDPDPQAVEKKKQAAEAAVQKYLEEQRHLQAPTSAPPTAN